MFSSYCVILQLRLSAWNRINPLAGTIQKRQDITALAAPADLIASAPLQTNNLTHRAPLHTAQTPQSCSLHSAGWPAIITAVRIYPQNHVYETQWTNNHTQ